jgi:DNA-binding transcriptional regulator YdaS (Cro superfamily)
MERSTLIAMGRAIDFFGNHRAMARALGIRPRELWRARRLGRVPGRLADKIHQLTYGTVRREELRPDLFPTEHHYERIGWRRNSEKRSYGK